MAEKNSEADDIRKKLAASVDPADALNYIREKNPNLPVDLRWVTEVVAEHSHLSGILTVDDLATKLVNDAERLTRKARSRNTSIQGNFCRDCRLKSSCDRISELPCPTRFEAEREETAALWSEERRRARWCSNCKIWQDCEREEPCRYKRGRWCTECVSRANCAIRFSCKTRREMQHSAGRSRRLDDFMASASSPKGSQDL